MSNLFIRFSKPIYYTRHAKSRMRWRKISREEVEMTLAAPQRKEGLGNNRYYYFRTIGRKLIRVTLTQDEKHIVIISVVDKNN